MKLSRDKIQRMVGSQSTMGGFGGVAGITEQRVYELLQDYVTNDDLTETLESYATKDWVGSNYLSLSFFNALFQARKADGTTIVSPNNGDTSEIDSIKAMFGFWTDQYLSALGQGDDGSAGVGDVTWALLADSSDTRPIALSHLTTALSTYATQTWVQNQGYATQTWVTGTALAGYATQSWVQSQGYATTAAVNALEFLNNVTGGNGLVTLSTNKSNSFVVDLTHQHSWFEIQDRPTTLAGFGITDASISNGVITIGASTITPVTQVALTMPTGFSVSGSPVTKTGTFAITFATGYEGFTTALKQKIEALYSWFEVDADGNVKTKDWDSNGTTKHRGFYSPSFISALGQGDDGSAGSGDVTWALLADSSDTRQIASSHLSTALAGYATQAWVNQQGFLTQHQSLANYYTKSETNTAISTAINVLEYLNNITSAEGYVTFATNKSHSFVLDLTHQHSWFEIQDRPTTITGFGIVMTADDIPALDWSKITTGKPTTLAGYGITDANINNGVITLGSATITPVTQVALTMPTGFSVSGSPVTKTGTFAITFATGYEGFTTALKQKIEALYSWFEVDGDGNIKTKDYTENSELKHRGFYSPSFISALGLGNDGGGGGAGDVTWALLADSSDTRPIALSHLTTALSTYATQTWVQNQGYATQSWVQSQGYATTAAVNALEFLNNVTGSNGLVTLSTNKSHSFVLDITHQHSWFDVQDRPDTIAGYNISDAKIVNGTITLGANSITPLTQHQSLANYYTKAETNSAISTAISALEYLNQTSGGSGLITLTTNKSHSFVLDLTHQHSWFEIQDRPTTIDGYSITGGKFVDDITFVNTKGINLLTTANAAKKVMYLSAANVLVIGSGISESSYNTYLRGYNVYLKFGTTGATGLILNSSGNVGIGTSSPSSKLHVDGDIYATGGVTALVATSSDIRKKNVVSYDLPLTLNQIADAPTIKFTWKDNAQLGEQVGSIAQYWQKVLPQTIRTEKDDTLSLQYGVAALVAAITTARKVVDHERRIRDLERENEFLKEQIKQLKAA